MLLGAGLMGRGEAQPEVPFGERVLLWETPTHREFSCHFLSPLPSGDARNDIVWGYFLLPRASKPVPGVVVLHSLGNTDLDNELRLARSLVREGMAVLAITLPYHMERLPPGTRQQQMIGSDLVKVRRAFEQAIGDAQAALSWLQQQPEVDPQRLAIVGISLGAIIGGTALGKDERVEAAVLILGGGRVGSLVWHSFLLRPLRRAALQRGWGPERLNELWQEIDPAQVAQPQRSPALLLINARYDWAVPKECALALWEAWGRPKQIWLNAGHYGAGLYRSLLIDLTVRFLKWALVEEQNDSLSLPSRPLGYAPKIQALWAKHGGFRLGLALEVGTLDADGDWALDVGFSLTQLYAGLTVNVLGTGGSGYADLGIGYALDRHGRTSLVVLAGFHF